MKRKLTAAMALIAFVSTPLLTGCSGSDGGWFAANATGSERRFSNTDITGSEIGRSLNGLRDVAGRSATLADYRGKVVIVFFGYTSCPDACPTTLARLAGVLPRLGEDAGRVQVVLVTVDPEHDTPERLAAYVKGFDPSFIGLSGSVEATDAVAGEFKAFIGRHAEEHEHEHEHGHESEAATRIDHSAGIYVFDPSGRIRLYVKDDAPDDAIVGDLKRLLAVG